MNWSVIVPSRSLRCGYWRILWFVSFLLIWTGAVDWTVIVAPSWSFNMYGYYDVSLFFDVVDWHG